MNEQMNEQSAIPALAWGCKHERAILVQMNKSTMSFFFTDFLSGFLFRVKGRARVNVGVGGGFRVKVRVRASVRAR